MADISFFQPEQEAEIKRRRKYAELLGQNIKRADPNATAGGLVVPISPLQGLVEGLGVGMQAYNNTRADELEAERSKAMGEAYSKALSKYGSEPNMAAQELMGVDPQLAIQLMNANKNTDEKTSQIKNWEYLNSLPPEQRAAASTVISPKSAGKIGYDENGNPVITDTAPELSVRDQIALGKQDEQSSSAQAYLNQAEEALNLLQNIETGKATPIKGALAGWGSALGIGGQETKDYATDYDRLVSLSNELGAQALQQFGGNDTDKELQVAIKSGLSPSSTKEANIENAKRKIIASQILAQKGEFYTQFANKNGSLKAIDPDTGKSLTGSWMDYQREMFKTLKNENAGQNPAQVDMSGWKVEEIE